MIPSDVRLYTWLDVEDVLLRKQNNTDWPEWLIWARAYWDGLTLGIRKNAKTPAKKWLVEQFEPRFDKEKSCILLESINGKSRLFQVFFEETEETPPKPRTLPSLARPTMVLRPYDRDYPLTLPEEYPPVIAFHSFKGGVGRTLHALAFARVLSQRYDQPSRIILIDGDLEAPGLTWLLYSRIPRPGISFMDLLALVHGDPGEGAGDSVRLAAEKIKDMLLEGIYVLPAFRAVSHFNSLEIKPEHLIKSSTDPYIITKILAELGKELGASAVIIDLRAGLSELSTGLLLDPRVYRVIITSLSAQSIEGTSQLLKTLSRLRNPKSKEDPRPAIIITMVPEHYQKSEFLSQTEEKLIESANFLESDTESGQDEGSWDTNLLNTPFDQDLIVLPDNWDEVIKKIQKSNLIEQLSQMCDWLPEGIFRSGSRPLPISIEEFREKRRRLTDFTHDLIMAETSKINKFLTISSLRNLASDFRNKVPVAVIVGAKGAGKTYTYLQIARRKSWQKFIQDAVDMDATIKADVVPVLFSRNLHPAAHDELNQIRINAIKTVGLDQTDCHPEVLDYLRDNLRKNLHEGQWRDCWLNIIAWKCGFEIGKKNVGKKFNDFLVDKKQLVVAIIDGLEDLFQDLSSAKNEQTALRALLQDVPEWLEQQPSRQIGLIVFVRRDMIFNAVKQNPAQLIAKYSPYELKWDSIQALRLVAWISIEAGVLATPKGRPVQGMDKPALVDRLIDLWGRKLGSERSNEARSSEWVIYALSDLNGQIQARDIVRLLNKSALDSQNDTYWKDRVLVPPAIRKSVDECSLQKIKEIKEENPHLSSIMNKLKSDTNMEVKRIPFNREQVDLELSEITMLEHNGVIIKEKEGYYMPEIFRRGLDFKFKKGARPRVLSLSRRARK
jgi:MinD-like ATPase involved in chromosome partitioning or flagellar assembly